MSFAQKICFFNSVLMVIFFLAAVMAETKTDNIDRMCVAAFITVNLIGAFYV